MLREFRYALRGLRRSPVLFTAAVSILAAGIGANTAVFSAINHLLIRPLPFADPGHLAIFGEQNASRGIRGGVSRDTFERWQENKRSFESLGALLDDQVFPLPGQREALHGARVSANFFDVLRVRAAVGRTFVAADGQLQAPNVVVISDEFWRTRWARDPGVLGRTLEMSNRKWTVVGVLPPGFRMLYSNASVWVPLDASSGAERALFAIGRLRASETPARASAELAAARTMSEDGWTVWGKPLRDYIIGDRRPLAVLLFVTVALVLATACLNVGALLIARATGRLKDAVIRMSLGASRWRMVRESLAEAAVLSSTGTAVGLAVAVAMRRIAVAAIPELRDFTIDGTVVAFAVGLSACAAAVVACGPALVASRALASAAARKGTRLRSAFVVAQTALAVALLVGVGVLIRSLAKLQATDPGFRSAGVVVAEVELPEPVDPARAAMFVRVAMERAAATPYVRSAAAATAMPLFSPDRASFEVEGRGREEALPVARRSVSPEYLSLFDIPMRRGRYFSSTDDERAPRAAIVNERAAELFWPNGDPMGQRVRFRNGDWAMIVGVAGNVRSVGLRRPPIPEIFVPFSQQPTARVSLVLRVEGDPVGSLPALHDIALSAEPRSAVTYANTMPALLDEQLVLVRALSTFGAVFAAIATVLAAIGLYGAISCLYQQRTKEIGIRLALGATRRAIVRMVAASSARLAITGCLVGMVAGAAVGRVFQAAVFGVAGVDAMVLAAVAVVAAAVVFVATCGPAARAAGVEPAVAVRCE